MKEVLLDSPNVLDVVVDLLAAFEILEEGVKLISVVDVRPRLPFDVEALQSQSIMSRTESSPDSHRAGLARH